MKDRVCVVTGANSGIGKAMATDLAALGGHVVMVCRNEAKGSAAREEIERVTGNPKVELRIADVADPASVEAFAASFAADHDRVDVLMNNAGVYLPERFETPGGHEMMHAINHLGAFHVTRVLLDALAEAPQGRVITTSSFGHHLAYPDLEDLDCRSRFLAMRQYGTTKLCNVLFTRELARRVAERGVVANCFHPGAVRTNFAQQEPGLLNGLMKIGGLILRSPQKGGETGVYLASAPEAGEISGEYFTDKKPGWKSSLAKDDALAERLWAMSEDSLSALV